MTRHVVIAAGGSGGHVLPAQVVADELLQAGLTTSFAAFGLLKNAFLDRSIWRYHDITAAPPSAAISFFTSTARGTIQALRLLRQERPSLVIGFGSYHAFPVLTAASLLRIPIVLYAADAIPGRAIRLFAPFAKWTGCFFQEATTKIRGAAYHVDFPLRKSLRTQLSKEEGCRHFSIDPQLQTVLILGGSQGAQVLNSIVPKALAALSTPPAVIHLAGAASDINAIAADYHQHHITASVHAYEHAMHYAFAAADVVIARAGASTIAEIEACQKLAIYIPYPQAKDNHQKINALLAAARGRAVVIDESDASPESIAIHMQRLLEPCPQKCEYQQKSSVTFVTKILQTIDEVTTCQGR